MSRKKTSVSKSDVKGMVRFAKRYPILAVILAVIVIGIFVFQSVQDNANKVTIPMDGLYVHYIDVGQGDSELICCGGEYMLIDAGEPSASDTVVDYLNDHGIEKLEYVVCSHGHADHCGGLDAVVENFEVGTVFKMPPLRKVLYIHLPQLKPFLMSACATALGMAWKAGVAAEIIGAPDGLIGKQLFYSKIYLDTDDLLCWTVIIVIISVLFEKLFMIGLRALYGRLERG